MIVCEAGNRPSKCSLCDGDRGGAAEDLPTGLFISPPPDLASILTSGGRSVT